MKKRILCVVLAGMLLFALCACGNTTTTPSPTPTKTPTPTPTATPAASPDPDKVNVVIETEKGTIKRSCIRRCADYGRKFPEACE